MKSLFYSFIALLAFTVNVKAQTNISDLAVRFANATTVQWQVPLPKKATEPIEWQWRNNSLANEGARTFVGYYKGQLIGVLSVRTDYIAGSLTWDNHQYLISTEKGKLVVTRQKEGKCGVEGQAPHSHTARPALQAETTDKIKAGIYTDSVLRYYRFALVIDYNVFVRYYRSNKQYVRDFWGRAEVFMNELYNREVGVAFTMVVDDRLIIDSKDKEYYNGITKKSDYEINTFTKKINELIGSENYDLGGIMTNLNNGALGLASTGGAYRQVDKGDLYTNGPSDVTLLHEVGHLFGTLHTFSYGGKYTYETEPGHGSSIMGYGTHYENFFSLPCLYMIKSTFAANGTGYYADKERKNLVGFAIRNTVYGIETHNRAPIIDRDRIKASYTIPPQTNFQFYIPATDPDDDPMLYAAHQADFVLNPKDKNKARFTTFPFSSNPLFVFQDRQRKYEVEPYSYMKEGETGEFTFWLSASDGGYTGSEPHAVRYDVVETTLKVEKGTPFKIDKIQGSVDKLKRGEKMTITWGADQKIFGKDSKVRILYSDDEGATFKYVLAESVPNNGKAEVIFPINAAAIKGSPSYVYPYFKIEVVDHIAFAVKRFSSIEAPKPAITLHNLPEAVVRVKEDAIPAKAEITATTSCKQDGSKVNLTYNEEVYPTYHKRTWVAKDGCNNTVTFQQFIYIEKEVYQHTLQWVNTPADIHIQCKGDVPAAPEVKATGADNIKITLEENRMDFNDVKYVLRRHWVASAPGAAPIAHTQLVTVGDTQKPTFSAYPKNYTVKSIDEVPPQEELTATDNCDGNLTSRIRKSSNLTTINGKQTYERVWIVSDYSKNEERYVQYITIDPDATQQPDLAFVPATLPANITVACAGEVPTAKLPTTQGGCANVRVTYSDTKKEGSCPNQFTIERTFAAIDDCTPLKPITYTQIITVIDKIAPTFVGTLPQDISIKQGEATPIQVTLTATDNCTGEVKVTTTKKEEINKITYHWLATDLCGNQATHQQVITIIPTVTTPTVTTPTVTTPTVTTPTVTTPTEVTPEVIVYNGVSSQNPHNYFNITNIDTDKPITLLIFDEMGLKVYENLNYGKPDYFTGNPNVKGIIGSKPLKGTYFYIVTYYRNGQQEVKKGYLYIN